VPAALPVAAAVTAPSPASYPAPSLPSNFRLETFTLPRERFHRVYWRGRDPLQSSVAGRNRYDCTPGLPIGQQFGLLYLGMDLETCWLEAVVRDSVVRPAGDPIEIPAKKMTDRWACEMHLEGEVTVANFADRSLVDLGETASNVMADSYVRTQQWSELLHAHNTPQVDGIQYRSRFKTSEFCIALFDRGIKKAKLKVHNARSIEPATSPEIQSVMNRYKVIPV
jgi:hypothetical protein